MQIFIVIIVVLMSVGCVHPIDPWQGYPYFLVKLKPGDSIEALSERYKVPAPVIQTMNQIENPRKLQIGQRLKIALRPDNRQMVQGPIYNYGQSNTPPQEDRDSGIEQGLLFGGEGSLLMPVKGRISSGFGRRGRRMHEGIDIRARMHQPIHAAQSGRIVFAGWKRGYGRTVVIRHDEIKTLYAHCQKLLVSRGDWVTKGQRVATVGRTGRASGPHLHFEVRTLAGTPLNPFSMRLAESHQ